MKTQAQMLVYGIVGLTAIGIICLVLYAWLASRTNTLRIYDNQPRDISLPPDVVIHYQQLEHGRDKLPAFAIAITQNGDVEYTGRKYVKVVGTRTTTIPREKVDGILADAQKMDFLSIDLDEIPCLPDSIHRQVVLRVDGNIHSIRLCSYHESSVSPAIPLKKLFALEQKILEASTALQWVAE